MFTFQSGFCFLATCFWVCFFFFTLIWKALARVQFNTTGRWCAANVTPSHQETPRAVVTNLTSLLWMWERECLSSHAQSFILYFQMLSVEEMWKKKKSSGFGKRSIWLAGSDSWSYLWKSLGCSREVFVARQHVMSNRSNCHQGELVPWPDVPDLLRGRGLPRFFWSKVSQKHSTLNRLDVLWFWTVGGFILVVDLLTLA